MKKIFLLACVCVIAILIFACASQPTPTPTPEPTPTPVAPAPEPTPTPTPEPVVQAAPTEPLPETLQKQAKDLRQRVISNGFNEMLKIDFEKADSDFAAGENLYGKDNFASKTAYQAAITQFQAILDKGQAIIAADQGMQQASLMRIQALKVDANSYYPNQFKIAQDAFEAAQKSYNAGEYATVISGSANATGLFEALQKTSIAAERNDTITTWGFAKYDTDAYQRGQGKFAEAESLFNVDNAKAVAAANEAIALFDDVLKKGPAGMMTVSRDKANESKQAALDLKADVAVPDDWQTAESEYKKASVFSANGDFQSAANSYDAAAPLYDIAAQNAEVKRAAALAAMQEAENRTTQSAELAAQAETQITEAEAQIVPGEGGGL